MLFLAALILLTLSLKILVSKILAQSLIENQNNCARLKCEYDKLVKENTEIKKDALHLKKLADETLALYDFTKDVRKILDEDKIFELFKERINTYLSVGDCLFLKKDADLNQYRNYTVLPLSIEEDSLGYLAARDIEDKDKDRFHILAQQFLSGIKGAFLFKRLQGLTVIDSLTQVFNRRYFLERFKEELNRSKKFKLTFSLLMLDIDHFKNYNDHYGHLVGDAVLKEVVRCLKENMRQIDFIGRYGGEELSIILVETDKEEAVSVSERIRQAIALRPFLVYDEKLKVTISIGVSTFPQDGNEESALIDNADCALYQAKEAGRNRVCAYGRKI